MRPYEQIIADFRGTFQNVREEEMKRQEVMATDDYRAYQRMIDDAQEKQKSLLNSVPDSRKEYDLDKKELQDYMQENGLKTADEFKAKTRAIRTVDTRAVLEAMQGDIDNLMIVSSVKMKDLEDFAKANPEYKNDLRSCIREEGFTITDIVLAAPDA